MLKELKSWGVLSQVSTEPPKVYVLPKVHKPLCPLRPVVVCRCSILYSTTRFVANILSPLVGNTQHHLHNCVDLVKTLTPIRLHEDESIISFDGSALITSVPVEESLTLIQELLEADPTLSERISLSPQQVSDLLTMCLTTTYFKYNRECCFQIEGEAMGSPVSPIVANLSMEWFEVKALASHSDPPRF